MSLIASPMTETSSKMTSLVFQMITRNSYLNVNKSKWLILINRPGSKVLHRTKARKIKWSRDITNGKDKREQEKQQQKKKKWEQNRKWVMKLRTGLRPFRIFHAFPVHSLVPRVPTSRFRSPGKKGSVEIFVSFFGIMTYSPGSRGEMLNGIPGDPIDFGKMSTHICSFPCE